MKLFPNSLFVFNRDLRMHDNRALLAAAAQSERVACAFVVDPVFNREPAQRRFAKHFLLSCLVDIDKKLHEHGASLHLLSGSYADVLNKFAGSGGFDAVFMNSEYTDAGRRRQQVLQEKLGEIGIPLFLFDDALLFPPGFVLKSDGAPYTVFTPFYNRARQFPVEKCKALPGDAVFLPGTVLQEGGDKPGKLLKVGDLASIWAVPSDVYDVRNLRMAVIDNLTACREYSERRDFPALDATSHLSTHLRFGTISIREAYWAVVDSLGAGSPLLRQFYWRDFFSHIGFHFPHVFRSAFHRQYSGILWDNDREKFRRWCEGRTGFPIVDAGMRELNQTGFMHNRVRMIVASFLVKDLHIDWRWGERYFMENLLDYDRAVNNGNWQWAASTGCDAQPYFRIFNPWLQQQKFDPACEYIYRWIPELRALSPREIHRWHDSQTLFGQSGCDYPLPMLDHASAAAQAKALFKSAALLSRH